MFEEKYEITVLNHIFLTRHYFTYMTTLVAVQCRVWRRHANTHTCVFVFGVFLFVVVCLALN